MHRIDTPTAQVDKFGAGKNGFTAGNPQTGTPATDLDETFFDMLQEELAKVVESTGVALDKTKHDQLKTALTNLFQGKNTTLTSLSGLAGAANKIPYFTGPAALALTTLTDVGRSLIEQSTQTDVLNFLGITFTAGNGYIILKVGPFIIAVGNANTTTTSQGNLNVTLPTTFPNTVMFSVATQANSSYATDTDPIIYSPYSIGAGPITAVGFAARNSKTGAPLANTIVASRYLVVGF